MTLVPVKDSSGHIYEGYIDDSRELVVKLSQLGCTDDEIANILGIGEASVHRHFRQELNEGRGNLRSSLRKAQVQAAIVERNPTMLIWLGKQYLGQREPKQNIEHSGGFSVEQILYAAEIENDTST